jgi:hypothetical protein
MPCAHRKAGLDNVFFRVHHFPPDVFSDASRMSQNSVSWSMSGSNTLVFDTRSNWGHPKTLVLKVASVSRRTDRHVEESLEPSDLGCGFVDLCPMWNMIRCVNVESKTKVHLFDSAVEFDQHGETVETSAQGEEVRYASASLLSQCISFIIGG